MNRKHSRTWVHADIETIGTMDPFHFRLTTYAETYNFDLKERLSPEDYRSVWHSLYSQTSESQPGRSSLDIATSQKVGKRCNKLEKENQYGSR